MTWRVSSGVPHSAPSASAAHTAASGNSAPSAIATAPASSPPEAAVTVSNHASTTSSAPVADADHRRVLTVMRFLGVR